MPEGREGQEGTDWGRTVDELRTNLGRIDTFEWASLFMARTSNPLCTPSKAGSISLGEEVEANKFLRLLLPRLFEAEPSLDPEEEEETVDEELDDPDETLRSPKGGIPGVAFLGEEPRPSS